jgi:hypothetical protein
MSSLVAFWKKKANAAEKKVSKLRIDIAKAVDGPERINLQAELDVKINIFVVFLVVGVYIN